ncbi:MAG: hypothetical protein ABIK15_03795 [Pseudomonadota bacterium]
MTIKNIKIIGLMITLYAVMAFPVFGDDQPKDDHDTHHADSHMEHHHKTHHGGCLNAVTMCEIAHIEVKVSGDVMKCWFVGGGHDTDKAVHIPEKQIILSVKFGNNEQKKLILKAKPIELAEETIGHCSCFEGQADWLSSLKEFKAYGKATVKGKIRDIEIHYPEGYDPDHEHKHEHSEKNKNAQHG